jgi:hypothetical protein
MFCPDTGEHGEPAGQTRNLDTMTSQQRGPGSVQDWALRTIPLTLLIILAMAGLRGAVVRPKWTASHGTDIAIGLAIFVVFAALFVIVLVRHRAALRAPTSEAVTSEDAVDPVRRLRSALMFILVLAMAADLVAVLYGLHLKLPSARYRRNPLADEGSGPPKVKISQGHYLTGGSFPLTDVLWGILVVVLIAAIVLTVRWLSHQQRVQGLGEDELIAEDSASLREAVESGRSALRIIDDARAAIIACYAAMEQSMASHGAARAAADTPDELLARATRERIVHGPAPARLTALFYEARFSSHPMDQAQRQAAEQALDDLAEALQDRLQEASA